ncbi:hypothetical protein AYO38_11225 [bacterium SCGC AG-212-C10]|nr:hypothetical protein AYO38_11225 [bacterium SCGC AG-212-C10]
MEIDTTDGRQANRTATLNAESVLQALVAVRSNAGGGSGTAWGPDLVVTNHHVAPGDDATVVTHDERELAADVIAHDPEHDLALLRIDGGGLMAATPGASRSLRPGNLVYAAGNPWGTRGVVTAGIVISINGATAENGVPLERAIRADLRIAPGNSGGPMFDAAGRVVGINSMISGAMAVAVPVEDVVALVAAPLAEERGFIGIFASPVPVPEALAASYPIPDGAALMLTGIHDGSPADVAGLIPGDLLLGVDGEAHGLRSLERQLHGLRRGRPSRLMLLRGGSLLEATVTPVARA